MVRAMFKVRWPTWAFLALTLLFEYPWAFGTRWSCMVFDHAPTSDTCPPPFPGVYMGHGQYWVLGPWWLAFAAPLVAGALVALTLGIALFARRFKT
jgi:hypothetical protein